jgi:benzoate/toluate 1,2-dioxygenase alpha subunit
VRGYLNGHSSEASLFDKEQSGGGWEEYRSMLVALHGESRTAEILKNKRHTMTYFPAMDIIMAQTAIRVVRPISVDMTEVEIWPVRLKGAPESLAADLIRYANISHAAASFIQTDDLEGFERCQQGLQAQGSEWVRVAKGLGDEIDEGEGVQFGPRSSEVGQRMRHYAWRDFMSA